MLSVGLTLRLTRGILRIWIREPNNDMISAKACVGYPRQRFKDFEMFLDSELKFFLDIAALVVLVVLIEFVFDDRFL